MARVQGVKEKLHSPIYDAFLVKEDEKKTFKDFMTDPRVIRFFVDVQNKTKLETNLQAAGMLPSLNTFEARAMRVVASTFCVPPAALHSPVVRNEILEAAEDYRKIDPADKLPEKDERNRVVRRIRKAIESFSGTAHVNSGSDEPILRAANEYRDRGKGSKATQPTIDQEDILIGRIAHVLEGSCAAASTVLADLVYNSVTTLLVGEKVMIEVPTFYFPAGAGVSQGNGGAINHGEPNPQATFRFSEPVIIEPQQNFRVEMLFPQGVPGDAPVAGNLANVSGPLRIWVLLDGYLTRDVQ